jgi:cytochrome c oxidase assembly protein subunit 11
MSQQRRHSNRATAIIVGAIAFSMLLMSFASVPLYRVFCQVTGYGGTPRIGINNKGIVTDRLIRVQFNADVNHDMPWRFVPLQHEVQIYAGQPGLAFFQAENLADKPVVGMATYNVTPLKAGQYFSKVHCFCFVEQKLNPGEPMDMPVQFYIDPDIVNDPDLSEVKVITLSYTFFPLKRAPMLLF